MPNAQTEDVIIDRMKRWTYSLLEKDAVPMILVAANDNTGAEMIMAPNLSSETVIQVLEDAIKALKQSKK